MSSLEAGADDFAYEEPAETKPLVPATPRELKRLIKDLRSGRATRNVVQAMGDAYVAVFAAVMIGAMVVNVILKAQRTIAQCSSVTCLSARAILPWAAFATTIAVALAASRLFGPVLASAAEGFWLLEAPISRAKLLRSRLVAAVVAAFLGGAVIGTLISALTGSALIEVLVWAAATALSAAASVAFAAAQQGIERHRLTHLATYLFGLLAVGALFSVIGVAAGWFSFGLSENVGIELGLIMIAASMLGLLISAVLAGLRLAQIRRARLMSGGALVSGISGAFFALDIGLAHDIVVERRAIERGHVHPKRGKGLGLQALIWREWQRLWRFPQPLLVLAATIVVPYAADALGTYPRARSTRLVRRNGPAARRTPGPDAFGWAGPLPAVLAGPHQARIDRRTRDLGWALGRRNGPGLSRLRRWGSPTSSAGSCVDRHRDWGSWAARGGALDPGEGSRLRRTHGRQSSRGLSSGAGDQPVPRI
jgi:hypothetical protein